MISVQCVPSFCAAGREMVCVPLARAFRAAHLPGLRDVTLASRPSRAQDRFSHIASPTLGRCITIRSSRHRFVASPLRLRYASAKARHCAARLNSGVRPVQKQRPVNKHQAKLAVVLALPRLLIFATNSVPARAPALRFWVLHLAKSGCRH